MSASRFQKHALFTTSFFCIREYTTDILTLTVNFKQKLVFIIYIVHVHFLVLYYFVYCLTTSIQINMKWLAALVITTLNDLWIFKEYSKNIHLHDIDVCTHCKVLLREMKKTMEKFIDRIDLFVQWNNLYGGKFTQAFFLDISLEY